MTMSSGHRLGVAADHQRTRKRPGLRGEVGHPRARKPDLFLDLAPHRFLDRFAGLGEAGETRPHGRREPRRAAEHAAVAGDREHDDDRIGARKMLGMARRAIAAPAALGRLRHRAAIGTETVPGMPAEHRLGLRQRRQMLRGDESLHGDAAQVDDAQSRPLSSASSAPASNPMPKRGAPSSRPRNTVSRGSPSAPACAAENNGSKPPPRWLQHDGVAGDRIKTDARVAGQCRQRGRDRCARRPRVRGGCPHRRAAGCSDLAGRLSGTRPHCQLRKNLGAKPGLIHFLPLRWRFGGIEAVTGREGQGGRQRPGLPLSPLAFAP